MSLHIDINGIEEEVTQEFLYNVTTDHGIARVAGYFKDGECHAYDVYVGDLLVNDHLLEQEPSIDEVCSIVEKYSAWALDSSVHTI